MIGEAAILTGYAVLAAVAVVLTLRARHADRSGSSPTAYLATLIGHSTGRWLVFLLWMWTGWHFFVR